jgi:ribonuclease D
MDVTPIAAQADLERLVGRLRCERTLALDTEFMRERTYYPRLCLLQIAAGGVEVHCVDPLAGLDLEPLFDLLLDPQVTKVLHSARQDLEVFSYLCGGAVPGPVFDTQLAASFCGMSDQIGYAPLAAALLGVEIAKLHTRTDWARRPLSAEQLAYARADVQYLPALANSLRARLAARGREAWVEEECARLTDPALYRIVPEQMWRRVKGAFQLPAPARYRLRALAAWREAKARALDKPRAWVVSDADLIAVASHRLGEVRDLLAGNSSRAFMRHARELLAVVEETARHGVEPERVAVRRPVTAERDKVNKVLELIRARAREQGLSPHFVASRRDIERAVAGKRDSRLFQGWRKTFIGDELAHWLAEPPSLESVRP